MASQYEIGDAVPLTWAITVAGVATNATVVLTLTAPDGTTSTPAVSNPTTGNYAVTATPTLNGTYKARWVATGAVTAAETVSFVVGGICSLAEVKLQLGKTTTTDDAELQSYIDAVAAPIEAYCGAVLPFTVTNERHDPCGSSLLFLRSERVASITSLNEFQGATAYLYTAALTPASGGTYTYLLEGSMVRRIGASGYETPFTGPVYVTYTAGFTTIPTAINLAARIIVQRWWETQRGNALSQSGDVPISAFTFFASRLIPELLALYRRGPVVG